MGGKDCSVMGRVGVVVVVWGVMTAVVWRCGGGSSIVVVVGGE